MLLSPYEHRHLVWTPIDNRSLAAKFPTLNLLAEDVEKLAERLPIVIPVLPQGQTPIPVALITPTQTENPFGEHMPRLLQDYPFSLAPQVVCVDEAGAPIYQDALWADPNAPHWQASPQNGYRLFDDHGQPSEALQQVLKRLRALQPSIARTQALVELLDQAGALSQQQVRHLEQNHHVFRVVTDEDLGDRLDDLDPDRAGQARLFADWIAHSQKALTFLPPTPSPYGGVFPGSTGW